MPTILQFRRGTAAQNANYAGSAGEITVDTTNGTLRVHDGATNGGSILVTETATQTLTNKTLTSPNLTTPTIGGTAIDEYIADTIGAMVSGNTESGIAVTYDDTDNTLDFDVGDFTITLAGDLSGSATVTNLGNATLTATIVANSVALGTDTTGNYVGTITAGTGITSSGATTGEGVAHTLALATSGVTANTYGSSTAIPVLTVDTYGRITSATTSSITVGDGALTLATSGTGLSGSASFSANQSGATTFTVTSNATSANTASTIVARDASGNFTAGTITATLSGNATYATSAGSITSQANSATITATSSNTANQIVLRDASGNFSANIVTATSTSARYADLAERYQADAHYAPGTVMVFGGDQEVTVATKSHDPAVAGIVSTDPAYLMNSALTGTNTVAIALTGRVPCMVKGPVAKGSVLVTGEDAGVAQAIDYNKFFPGVVLGKSMGVVAEGETKLIEVAVGRF